MDFTAGGIKSIIKSSTPHLLRSFFTVYERKQ
jgi:hypothetical protein